MKTAGTDLATRFGVPLHRIGSPIGLRETDALFAALEAISGRPTPRQHLAERGRLVDAIVDGHKYIFGKRAIVYGEEDFVIGLTAFLAEIGVKPVLVATGAKNVHLERHVQAVCDTLMTEMPLVREGVDFYDIAEQAETLAPDILVGHSKGYRYAEAWNTPLVRVGFPSTTASADSAFCTWATGARRNSMTAL